MKAKPTCPECGSSRIAEILYGMPDFSQTEADLEAGRIVLGGCTVHDESPRWHCHECEHQFGVVDFDSLSD